MPVDYDAFFAEYVAAYNRSLTGPADTAPTQAMFAPCFIAAGPTGVRCAQNDASFVTNLEEGYAFYRKLGVTEMTVREIAVHAIDAAHDVARVAYRCAITQRGRDTTIDFSVSYLTQTVANETTIFAFIAGDETGLYRELGLLDDAVAPAT